MKRSRARPIVHKVAQGMGLIEVLIAVFVLAVGAVGLARMHSDFFGASALSKSRAEAVAIAQGRLEERRNYMHTIGSQTDFNTLFSPVTNSPLPAVTGINAVYNPTETIVVDGDVRDYSVTVNWRDAEDNAQAVTLNTEFTYIFPYASGVIASNDGPASPYPTGRARLGQGTLPNNVPNNQLSANDDGTRLYDAGDGNLRLVDDGDVIVLTLDDACLTNTCLDFVRIKGTVYLDKASVPNSLDPGDVFVQASNAAYCTRYFQTDPLDVSTLQVVDVSTSTALSTPGGDYEYFHYTCYLGGGWRGNIGILLNGGISQSDKVCQGDPLATNSWEQPVIALRRAYAGVIYEQVQPGVDPQYLSYGIADSVVLGDPADSTNPMTGHNFVLSNMSASKTEGSNCITEGVMVRADSNVNGTAGDLFAGVPGDFFCLNNASGSLLDTLPQNGNTYLADATCPYDPTDPPIDRYEVRGTVRIPATGVNDADIVVNTSDGAGNCSLESFQADPLDAALLKSAYACEVFDWSPGWSGYVTAKSTSQNDLFCSPNTISKTALKSDSDYNDFSCSLGNVAFISGNVTIVNDLTYSLDSVVMTPAPTTPGAGCQVFNNISYTCKTDDLGEGNTWTGQLRFVPTNGKVCPDATATPPVVASGDEATASFNAISGSNSLNVRVGRNNGACN